MAKMMVL